MVKKFVLLAFAGAVLIAAGACTMKQTALVNVNGSGEVGFNIDVEPFLLDTLTDMAALAGETNTLPDGQLFDVPQIKKDFAEQQGLELIGISTPRPEKLNGTFSFENIEAVFKSQEELAQAGIITLKKQGAETVLTVHLDKENYKQVSGLFPIVQTPIFEMFGPQEGENITESEYYEIVALAFGDAGERGLRRSFIELTIDVEGEIVSQSGGRIDGNSVVFTIPLIKVLMLEKPLSYSIRFK
jgi:hypothetical protein